MTDKETIREVCVAKPKFAYIEKAEGERDFYIGKLKIATVYDSVGNSPVYDHKIVFTGIKTESYTVGQGLRTNESKKEVHRMLLAYWVDFMLEVYTNTFAEKK